MAGLVAPFAYFFLRGDKERKARAAERKDEVAARIHLGYLRAANGIPGSTRPSEASAEDYEKVLMTSRDVIRPVGRDGTPLNAGCCVERIVESVGGAQSWRNARVKKIYSNGLIDLWFSEEHREELNVKPFAVRAPSKSRQVLGRNTITGIINKGGARTVKKVEAKTRGMLDHSETNSNTNTGFMGRPSLFMRKIKERQWRLDRQRVLNEVVYENQAPGQGPFALACQEGDLTSAIYLYRTNQEGLDIVRRTDALGRTPLMLACANGRVSIAKWLHENGAAPDVEGVTYRGSTCMSFACRSGNVDVCTWLLNVAHCPMGHLRQPDNAGLTPMHWAAAKGHTVILHFLRAAGAGADVRAFDAEGYSPMWRASLREHASSCHWLLLHGALRARYTSSVPRPEDSELDQAIYVEVCAASGAELSMRAWALTELKLHSNKLVNTKKSLSPGGYKDERDIVEEAARLRNLRAFVNHLGPSFPEDDSSNAIEPWCFDDLPRILEDDNELVCRSPAKVVEEVSSYPTVYVVEEWIPPLESVDPPIIQRAAIEAANGPDSLEGGSSTAEETLRAEATAEAAPIDALESIADENPPLDQTLPSRDDAETYLLRAKVALAGKPGGFNELKAAFDGLGKCWSEQKSLLQGSEREEERIAALASEETLAAARLVNVFLGIDPGKAKGLLEEFISMLVPYESAQVQVLRREMGKVFDSDAR